MMEVAVLERKEVKSSVKSQAVLPIYSVTPFTMLDYPGRTACIIWFSGCNMRCPYCHNPQIVKGKGRGNIDDVMKFLNKRKGLLDGVVLSGGEASAYPNLPDFIKKIKNLGYDVKLDTNGLRPDIINNFLKDNLLNYVALDYKAPQEKFKAVTGVEKYQLFQKTLNILCAQKNVPFEIRTTVHTELMNENDVNQILRDLDNRAFKGPYYLQNFCADNDRPTLGFLKQQKRILDIHQLDRPQNFEINYRNF